MTAVDTSGDARPRIVYETDEELLRRAVRGARPRRPGKHPRWVAVMDTFALGSTRAHMLCVRFGLDAEEMVKR